jgi:hypothetical protein|tara:strand:- start:1020 stop:1649 length:630 start_codon:yes stop_codon:yes gene_type:complete
MKKFVDDLGMTGHLSIHKKFADGTEELVFDDHNIIVSGMGVGLSYLYSASGSDTITDFQIDRFQLGVSGRFDGVPTDHLEVSSTYQLSGPLASLEEYGAGSNLYIEDCHQIRNDIVNTGDNFFALIPANKRTRIGNASVRYTLVVDEEAANSITRVGPGNAGALNEIGLFMKNPTAAATNASILVAYRTFSDIIKTSDFSLIFRWTLNF